MPRRGKVPRTRAANIPVGGRPSKDPMEKLSVVMRTKVTPPVGLVIAEDAKSHGFGDVDVLRGDELPVDYLRLCVWEHMRRVGIFDAKPELMEDPTWESLRQRGLA